MTPFQLPEGPYCIEQVMDEIHKQIIQSDDNCLRATDAQAQGEESETPTAGPKPMVSDAGAGSSLRMQLELMHQRRLLDPGYRIQSHRKFFGKFINTFKRVIHWGARPYTDAVRKRQEDFNEAALHALREAALLLGRYEKELGECKQALAQLLVKRDPHDIAPFFSSISPAKRLTAMDATRGPYEDIKMRMNIYVPLFEGAPGQIVDVGCGRGELLHLMRYQGLECWGADTDPLMVEECVRRGGHAKLMGALDALRSVPDQSLGGVFAGQVIEHFFPADLLEFIRLARRKLAPGGRMILETLNPAALAVLAKSYYRDLDHKQPVHPEYIKLLLELVGFEPVELEYLHPFREGDEKLAPLPPAEQMGLTPQARQALQERLDRLDEIVFGMQDYYVMAHQPAVLVVTPQQESFL